MSLDADRRIPVSSKQPVIKFIKMGKVLSFVSRISNTKFARRAIPTSNNPDSYLFTKPNYIEKSAFGCSYTRYFFDSR